MPELTDTVVRSSSFARRERTRRWVRYPGEVCKSFWKRRRARREEDVDSNRLSRPFIEAASVQDGIIGRIQGTANRLLAAIGYNRWVPKIPGQKGLRILAIDGGGTRGMTAVTTLRSFVKAVGGIEVCDSFDLIAGTSTGAIIAFLVGLKRETSVQAKERYNQLIKKIFVKSQLAQTMFLFTTAMYDETPFMGILSEILGDDTMLDSRADPAVPLVFAVTSKMSSTPTHVSLLRNYNYNGGEMPDSFTIDPDKARMVLGLWSEFKAKTPTSARRLEYSDKRYITGTKLSADASRHPGK
jgi:hypothetical protein